MQGANEKGDSGSRASGTPGAADSSKGRDFYEAAVGIATGKLGEAKGLLEQMVLLHLSGEVVPAGKAAGTADLSQEDRELMQRVLQAMAGGQTSGLSPEEIAAITGLSGNIGNLRSDISSLAGVIGRYQPPQSPLPGVAAPALNPAAQSPAALTYDPAAVNAMNGLNGTIQELLRAMAEGKFNPGKGNTPEPGKEGGEQPYVPPKGNDKGDDFGKEPGKEGGEPPYDAGKKEGDHPYDESAGKKEGAPYEGDAGKGEERERMPPPVDKADDEPKPADSPAGDSKGTIDNKVEGGDSGNKEGAADEGKQEPADPEKMKGRMVQLYELAKDARKKGQYQQAIGVLNLLGKAGFEEMYLLYTEVGVMHLMTGNFDAAEQTFGQVLQMENLPDYVKMIAEHNLGLIYEERGDLEKAGQFTKVIDHEKIDISYAWMPEVQAAPEPELAGSSNSS